MDAGIKNKLCIGIDPDSEAHGVAIYQGKELQTLSTMTLMEIQHYITKNKNNIYAFVIENVMAYNFVYYRNAKNNNVKVTNKIAMHVGRNQQSQMELQRCLDYHGINYFLIKPCDGNWANNEELFKKITGWKKRSNRDTRSAAYFGFLYAKNITHAQ